MEKRELSHSGQCDFSKVSIIAAQGMKKVKECTKRREVIGF